MVRRIERRGAATVTAEAPFQDTGAAVASPTPWRGWSYLFAVGASLAMLAIRLAADPWLGARPALIWFVIPIIFVAYRGGLGPGTLATAVAALSTYYFLVQPRQQLGLKQSVDIFQWLIFAASGLMVSVLSERLQRSRRRAEATVRDLARAQAGLAEGEERLRIANEVAGVGTYDADLRTGRARFSPEMCAILGVPEGVPFTLKEVFHLIHPDDAAEVSRRVAAADDPAGAGMIRTEIRVLRSDGEIRWMSWAGRTFFQDTDDGRRPFRRVGACIDVTDLRRAEKRLATQNAVSRVLADALTLGEATSRIVKAICEGEGWDFGAFWRVDATNQRLKCIETWQCEGPSLDSLAQATRGLTFPRGVGLPGRVWDQGTALLGKLVSADDNDARSRAALAAGLRGALAFPIILGDRVTGVIDFLARGVPGADPKLFEMFDTIGRQLGAFFDRKAIETERQRLEIQLRQAQKMEAIGQLSGGIAHDFNNILTAITANLQLALVDLAEPHPAAPGLKDAARATERAIDLVRQILLFARQQPTERRVIDLRAIGEQSVRLLRATLPAGVDLGFTIEPNVPPVFADATQIQQVLMNLGTNAWHALGQDNGRIEIKIALVDIDAERARALPGRRVGRWVRLEVRDNGMGMDVPTLERIFEPFFTTKGPDRGTGLGLAVVHGIVASHDGTIAVASGPGAGTTFEVYLPPAEGPVQELATGATTAPPGTGQHILFIDDEPMLGRSTRRVLERAGYRVTTFTDPRQALEYFASGADTFDLVITDMNMPNLSGLDVTRGLRAKGTAVPILLLSGNLEDEVRARAASLGVTQVIQKPWTNDALSETVHRLVRGGRLVSGS